MKIVINGCYGGFGLSKEALFELIQTNSELIFKHSLKEEYEFDVTGEYLKRDKTRLKPFKSNFFYLPFDDNLYDKKYVYYFGYGFKRTHPDLIKVIEKLGDKANGTHSKLIIVEIPDDVEYEIEDYDGIESVHEVHRSW